MRDIDSLIREYCADNFPRESAWILLLRRYAPKLTNRLDSATSIRKEFECHLQDSYEANLSRGEIPEKAWRLARDSFGDIELLAQEIRRARAHSLECLAIRALALLALICIPWGRNARIEIVTFFHPPSLGLMAACALAGFLLTRKCDRPSLRRYALCGAWIGLIWGLFRIFIVQAEPAEIGAPIAMILLSTFYGLFFAAPASRGAMAALMLAFCQFGVLASLARLGILSLQPGAVDAAFLKMVAAFSTVAALVGLVAFDIRKLHLRLAGVAAFGMVFAYIKILSNLTQPQAAYFNFICATAIPPLVAVLIVLPIHRLQEHLLKRAH